jgi:ribose 1,5-bisphosphokinase
LEARGRESAAEIEARLARAGEFQVTHPSLVRIGNDGALAEAGEKLLRLLKGSE